MPYPDVFDNIVITSKADLVSHSAREQVALCIHRLEAEVNNGGFHQFFCNSSGEFVSETLFALLAIGAPKTKELLEQAIAIAFPSGYPSDVSEISSKLANFDEVAQELEPLDQAFCRYQEPLSGLVNSFLERPSNTSLEQTSE